MLRNYVVCFTDVIEHRINDDEIYFDGDNLGSEVDSVFDVFAKDEDDAKEIYLRSFIEKIYERNNNVAVIKRECAARIIRRIVAGEILMLPREVVASKHFGRMVTNVYDVVGNRPLNKDKTYSNQDFRRIAEAINLNEYSELLDKEAVTALYVEIRKKDVFVQDLKDIL
ncbi:hypothetical protein [Butyrivibrio sp. AD3002]|uniref:hypothetical protein n=1 Tax=Butyrivibrio sp. AD3002 TaxID=1280670 RepID=UPI0003B4266C|nr:hypothetical protein [Butyrivibrio sp. AD3002]